MKIRAYKLTTQPSDLIDAMFRELGNMPPKERIRETATSTIRLEQAKVNKDGEWLIDFTKFRVFGPGKALEDRPNEDFELTENEFFGEETAGLYVPLGQYFILQYNHHGPRSAAIESYLNMMANDLRSDGRISIKDVELRPVLRQDAASRLQSFDLIKKLEFKVFIPGARQTAPKRRQSVGEFLDSAVVASARTMTVTLTSERSESLSLSDVRSYVADLLGMRSEVERLVVTGQADEAAPSAPIDLLDAQLSTERPVAAGKTRRFTLDDRYKALRSAYNEWARGGHI